MTTEERPYARERAWLAHACQHRPHARHAAALLRFEAARLGDRWVHGSPADLVGELREEVAAISARAAITASTVSVDANTYVEVDETLREVVVALDGSYRALSILCSRIRRRAGAQER